MRLMSPFTLEFYSWQQGAELGFPVPMVPIAEANGAHGGPPFHCSWRLLGFAGDQMWCCDGIGLKCTRLARDTSLSKRK